MWVVFLAILLSIAGALHCVHVYYTRASKAGVTLWQAPLVLPISYAVSSAWLGTQSVVMAKAMSEVLVDGLIACGFNIFAEWYFWIVLFLLIVTGGIWLYRGTRARGCRRAACRVSLRYWRTRATD